MNVDLDDGESIMTMAYEEHEWPTMNWSWELNELTSYALCYKHAADHLVSETNRINAYIVYPVMFLYRHYLEIQLKTHLKAFQEYLVIPRDIPNITTSHNYGKRCVTLRLRQLTNRGGMPTTH